jgi:hypothetical protein
MGAVPERKDLPPPPRSTMHSAQTGSYAPKKGDWPCQQKPVTDEQADPRLVAFMYRLLRDGAQAPGDVENHAIQARIHGDGWPEFTNCHLELYARSLVASLTGPFDG